MSPAELNIIAITERVFVRTKIPAISLTVKSTPDVIVIAAGNIGPPGPPGTPGGPPGPPGPVGPSLVQVVECSFAFDTPGLIEPSAGLPLMDVVAGTILLYCLLEISEAWEVPEGGWPVPRGNLYFEGTDPWDGECTSNLNYVNQSVDAGMRSMMMLNNTTPPIVWDTDGTLFWIALSQIAYPSKGRGRVIVACAAPEEWGV